LAKLLPEDIPPVFIWAYDPDWTPPDPDSRADEDGYEGRVKVPLPLLYTWFYFARKDGIYDLKELWKKALEHPDEIWRCKQHHLDPTIPDSFV
jgi:hypothetical protein